MKIITATLAAAALILAGAAPASAQKPPKPPGQQEVRLAAGADLITFSTPLTLSGDVKGAKAGVVVTLQQRPATSTAFSAVTTTKTDDKGRYTFTQRPRLNTTYRVVAATQPSAQSPDVLVRVRPLVGFRVSDRTPSRGERVRFSGKVFPPHDTRTVSIQRKRRDGSFTTILRTALRDAGSEFSRYSRRVRVRRTGTYRIRIAGHDDHAMGVSRERTLRVG